MSVADDPTSPPLRRPRPTPRHDLRAVALGAVAWAAALATLRLPHLAVAVAWAGAAILVGLLAWRGGTRAEHLAWLGVALVVGVGTGMRLDAVRTGPVARLAQARGEAEVTMRVTDDQVRHQGRFEDYVLLRGSVRMLTARGATWSTLREPVLVLAPTSWHGVRWGQTLRASGRLSVHAATTWPR